ncbi:MAG TPA: flagellin lysine-N-methylase [Chloroflexota bacterium]|nr:flagellin lysine-N-methylase [Chloroflexota bacterium]
MAHKPKRHQLAHSTSQQHRRVIVPAYLARFSCIGSACEDTCCSGWIVPVDRVSYRRYKDLQDPRLQAIFSRSLQPPEASGQSQTGLAVLHMEPSGRCGFLNDDSLCDLQLNGGEPLLCETCTAYPRVTTPVAGGFERAAVLSCPEAARLALLSRDAMDLVEIVEPKSVRMNLQEHPYTGAAAGAGFRALRHGAAGLLRSGAGSLEARLLALGLALRSLDRPSLTPAEVAATFERYAASLADLDKQLAAVEPRDALRTELLRELLVERFATIQPPARYSDLVARVAGGLQLRADSSVQESVIERYGAALRDVYEPYLAERPWLLSNLLVNHIYSSLFPLGGGRSMSDEYVLLVVRYALIKLHLVGLAASAGQLTDADVVEAIHIFQRAVDHDPNFLPHVLDLLRDNDVTSMAFMAVLIVS